MDILIVAIVLWVFLGTQSFCGCFWEPCLSWAGWDERLALGKPIYATDVNLGNPLDFTEVCVNYYLFHF